jgi:hypothetical protein
LASRFVGLRFARHIYSCVFAGSSPNIYEYDRESVLALFGRPQKIVSNTYIYVLESKSLCEKGVLDEAHGAYYHISFGEKGNVSGMKFVAGGEVHHEY